MIKKKERPQNKHLIPGANKNGRPKGSLNRSTIVARALVALSERAYDDMGEPLKGHIDIEFEVVNLLFEMAYAGNHRMVTLFMHYRYGKPK